MRDDEARAAGHAQGQAVWAEVAKIQEAHDQGVDAQAWACFEVRADELKVQYDRGDITVRIPGHPTLEHLTQAQATALSEALQWGVLYRGTGHYWNTWPVDERASV